MFERLHEVAAAREGKRTSDLYLEGQGQDPHTLPTRTAEDTMVKVRDENIRAVHAIHAELGALNVADMVAELSQVGQGLDRTGQATLSAKRFLWMPRENAVVKDDKSIAAGVRALGGYEFSWEDSPRKSEPLALLLYRSGKQQSTVPETTRISVASAVMEAHGFKTTLHELLESEVYVEELITTLMAVPRPAHNLRPRSPSSEVQAYEYALHLLAISYPGRAPVRGLVEQTVAGHRDDGIHPWLTSSAQKRSEYAHAVERLHGYHEAFYNRNPPYAPVYAGSERVLTSGESATTATLNTAIQLPISEQFRGTKRRLFGIPVAFEVRDRIAVPGGKFGVASWEHTGCNNIDIARIASCLTEWTLQAFPGT